MRAHLLRILSVWLSAFLLASCMALGSSMSPETRYYLLQPISSKEARPLESPLPPGSTVGVGPVTVPTYLDRPQMVTRLDGNRMSVDEFNRWGEPLDEAIERVLLENISALTGASSAAPFPWKRSLAVQAQVTVDVMRFDADRQGSVTLEARWQLLGEGGKKRILEQRTTIVRTGGGGYSQVVDIMNEMLMELARNISRDLASAFSRAGG